MSFRLALRRGTDTIDFMSAAYLLIEGGLDIQPPNKKEVWGGESNYSNGAQLIMANFENRSATIEFQVTGETRDALLDNISLIDQVIEAAKSRSITESGDRVELEYQWDGATHVTYYEVISGQLTWPQDVMSVEQVHQKTPDGSFVIYDFKLELDMAPFAYPISPVSGSPIAVELTNSNGTAMSNLTVNNRNDAAGCNYVEVSGDNLPGSYPLLTKLTLVNDSGEEENTGKVYIGVRKGELSFRHMLEDSDASFRIDGVSPQADADYSSGGTYSQLSFSDTEGISIIKWDFSDAEAEATQGPFRVLARCKDNTFWDIDANYRVIISYLGVTLFEGEWRSPLDTVTNLFDFGTVYLPPFGVLEGIAGYTIEIQGMRKTAGTSVVNLDYVALMPQDGGYRVVQYRGAGMEQFETTVDDGWESKVYHMTVAGKKSGLPYGLLPPITLVPGETQRLYFLLEGTSGSTEISRQLKVSLAVVPTYMVLA